MIRSINDIPPPTFGVGSISQNQRSLPLAFLLICLCAYGASKPDTKNTPEISVSNNKKSKFINISLGKRTLIKVNVK